MKEKSDMMIDDGQREREDCLGLGSFLVMGMLVLLVVDAAIIMGMVVDVAMVMARVVNVVEGVMSVEVVDAVCCCFGDFKPHRPPP